MFLDDSITRHGEGLGGPYFGRAILYTTTTLGRGVYKAVVSILAHLQSQKLFPGGGGV